MLLLKQHFLNGKLKKIMQSTKLNSDNFELKRGTLKSYDGLTGFILEIIFCFVGFFLLYFLKFFVSLFWIEFYRLNSLHSLCSWVKNEDAIFIGLYVKNNIFIGQCECRERLFVLTLKGSECDLWDNFKIMQFVKFSLKKI